MWEIKCQMVEPRADSTQVVSIEKGWEPFGVGHMRIYLRRQVPVEGQKAYEAAIRSETLREVGEWMRCHYDYKWCELKNALKEGRMPG